MQGSEKEGSFDIACIKIYGKSIRIPLLFSLLNHMTFLRDEVRSKINQQPALNKITTMITKERKAPRCHVQRANPKVLLEICLRVGLSVYQRLVIR